MHKKNIDLNWWLDFDLTCCQFKFCEQLPHVQYCLLKFYTETLAGILFQNCYNSLLILLLCPFTPIPFFSVFPHQIENASEVLITPLEKFRKEQIGAAKVRILQPLFLDFRVRGVENTILENLPENIGWMNVEYT